MGRCGCGDESIPKRSAKRLPPCIELDCDALPSRGRRMKAGDNIGGRNSSEGAWRRTPYHFSGRNMMSSRRAAGMKKRATPIDRETYLSTCFGNFGGRAPSQVKSSQVGARADLASSCSSTRILVETPG